MIIVADQHGERVDVAFDSMLTPLRRTEPGDESARAVQLWSLLPSELSGIFRPRVADVAGEVLTEIQQAVPEYARPLEGPFGKTITAGVQEAILQFVDRLGDPTSPADDRGRVFHRLGRHELSQGRNLDVLQTAYRVGARVAWRRMSEVGAEAGVPVSTLCLLAEAIFAYLDEMSALSIEGHTSAQAREVGAVQRRRRRLMDMLLSEPPVARPVLEELAKTAEWQLPEFVVAVAVEYPENEHDVPFPSLGDEALLDLESNTPSLLIPAPDVEGARKLEPALHGWRAAVGPRVALAEAAQSLRWARQALRLAGTGVLPDAQVIWCDDHLSDLWLLSDPFLIEQLAARVLAPLEDLKPQHRARLADTLLAWLETRANVRDIAARLSVHPQTVRARVHDLESLFGDRLEDPQQRFEMILALRTTHKLHSSAQH
ncbi:helix-turn-helix domain-containing protein [Amycolatopsis nigrescens]|uniref:PucR family transcriptional regulator n=1 Tax=Amycolatopsis nigrescens TaxID=381445 RepID=UPI000360BF14